jgi:hypothetical protein
MHPLGSVHAQEEFVGVGDGVGVGGRWGWRLGKTGTGCWNCVPLLCRTCACVAVPTNFGCGAADHSVAGLASRAMMTCFSGPWFKDQARQFEKWWLWIIKYGLSPSSILRFNPPFGRGWCGLHLQLECDISEIWGMDKRCCSGIWFGHCSLATPFDPYYFSRMNVSRYILVLDTSILAKSNMGRREYFVLCSIYSEWVVGCGWCLGGLSWLNWSKLYVYLMKFDIFMV